MAELEQKVYRNQGPIHCNGRGVQVCVNLYFGGLANLIPCFCVLKTFYKHGFPSGGRSDTCCWMKFLYS